MIILAALLSSRHTCRILKLTVPQKIKTPQNFFVFLLKPESQGHTEYMIKKLLWNFKAQFFDCFSLPLLFQGFCPPLACAFPLLLWQLLCVHQSEPCQMVSYRQLTAITGEHNVLPRSNGWKVTCIIITKSVFF